MTRSTGRRRIDPSGSRHQQHRPLPRGPCSHRLRRRQARRRTPPRGPRPQEPVGMLLRFLRDCTAHRGRRRPPRSRHRRCRFRSGSPPPPRRPGPRARRTRPRRRRPRQHRIPRQDPGRMAPGCKGLPRGRAHKTRRDRRSARRSRPGRCRSPRCNPRPRRTLLPSTRRTPRPRHRSRALGIRCRDRGHQRWGGSAPRRPPRRKHGRAPRRPARNTRRRRRSRSGSPSPRCTRPREKGRTPPYRCTHRQRGTPRPDRLRGGPASSSPPCPASRRPRRGRRRGGCSTGRQRTHRFGIRRCRRRARHQRGRTLRTHRTLAPRHSRRPGRFP